MDLELTTEDEAFRDELRAWLDDHLVGAFREHLGAGSPTDDAHWDMRLEWERELGERRVAQRVVAGAVRRARRDLHAGGRVPGRARPCPCAVLGGCERAGPARPDPVAARHRGAEAALPPSDHARRGVLGAGLQRAQRRLRPRVPAHTRGARRRRVGHQRSEDLDDDGELRRLDVHAVPDGHRGEPAPRHHDAPRRRPPARHRRPPDPQHRRWARVLRGVLRRRRARRPISSSAR